MSRNRRARARGHDRARSHVLTVDVLARQLSEAPSGPEPIARRLAEGIVAQARGAPAPFASAADLVLHTGLAHCWRSGWQPADLGQVFRRTMSAAAVELLVGAIAGEACRYAEATVHPRWRAQLAELGARVWWDSGRPFTEQWAQRAGLDLTGVLVLVLQALWALRSLPREPVLVPLPGTWVGAAAVPGGSPAGEVDPKMLARVRALLAKAESTSFPEEADAFFAKAQELMSRYSLERAVAEAAAADARPGRAPIRTGGRRIWLDNPYLRAKSMLVNAVARANRCQAVLMAELGFVTVLGAETDAEIVEVLSTSLLVQAGRAMLAAGSQADSLGTSRTRSFRQAFLISYARRIGERLTEAAARAEGEMAASVAGAGGGDTALLPVLAAREEAVAAFVAESYPTLITRSVSVSNAAGWTAGRAAADLAVLDVHPALD